MKKWTIPVFLWFLFSCTPKKKDLITGKWHAVHVENPWMDEQIEKSRFFFDTMGRNTSPEMNEQLYGTRNIDSLRQALQAQLDSVELINQRNIGHTWLDFQEDGLLIANFGQGVDTLQWFFDQQGHLMLDEQNRIGMGTALKINLLQLTREILKLEYESNGMTSIAIFEPAD